MMHILDKSIKEIHASFLRNEITPLELVKEAFRRAKEDDNNAFECLCEESALAFAASLTEAEPDNLLWGIPYACKDNISTKGIPTTGGSNILNGYVPLFDATVISRLKEKKAVLIGKTTLDELAMGGSGTTGHLGPTFNPYDPSHKRMIGGSSSGSAAAVAAGIVPFALGSDTGDSVRKPAGFAGLSGLKPTWGRVSRYGLFPFAPSLDHVGFLTRSSEDVAIILNAVAGRDPMDSTSSFRECENFIPKGDKPLAGKKIAVIQEIFDEVHDDELKRLFLSSIGKMKEEGAFVDFIPFERRALESLQVTYLVISCAEATSNNANLDGIKFGPYHEGDTYQEAMMKARTLGFSELIKRRFVLGSFALMQENQVELFVYAKRNRRKIVGLVNSILEEYDAIYAPSSSGIAPLFENGSEDFGAPKSIVDSHLVLANFAGLPSINLPLGFIDGMPVGCNFMGRAFDEKRLLEIAKGFEMCSGLEGLSVKNPCEGRFQ